jgi:hypothetical protein
MRFMVRLGKCDGVIDLRTIGKGWKGDASPRPKSKECFAPAGCSGEENWLPVSLLEKENSDSERLRFRAMIAAIVVCSVVYLRDGCG